MDIEIKSSRVNVYWNKKKIAKEVFYIGCIAGGFYYDPYYWGPILLGFGLWDLFKNLRERPKPRGDLFE